MFARYGLGRHIALTKLLVRKEVQARYRASMVGRVWLLIAPLCMLAIYSLFFGEILKAKWGTHSDSGLVSFGLLLFVGLILYQYLSECMSKATTIVLANANFVKKVIFPLEILPLVCCATAAIQMMISMALLLVVVAIMHSVHLSWLALPIVIFPLFVVSLGLALALAALGVFFRDLSELIGFVIAALMFLSPVFYPMSFLPEYLHFLKWTNPLVVSIEQARKVIFDGLWPDPWIVLIFWVAALLIVLLGLFLFSRSKRAFADVM